MIDPKKYLKDFISANEERYFVNTLAERTDTIYLRKMLSDTDDDFDLTKGERNTFTSDDFKGSKEGMDSAENDPKYDADNDVKEDSEENPLKEDADVKLNISDVISTNNNAIILGRPGAGKTTVLLNEAATIARRYVNGEVHTFPVYIALKNVKPNTPLSGIVNQFLDHKEFNDNIIFFLDGMNEVHSSCREDVIDTIKKISDFHPSVRVVLSSRLYGYDHSFDFPEYELCCFDNAAIKEYTVKRTGDDSLYKVLCGSPTVLDLCRTPLILRMTMDLYKESHKLPEFRSTLYDEFINYQISKIPNCDPATKKLLMDSMSKLAFNMRTSGFLSDNMTGFENVISDYANGMAVSTLRDLMMRSGLFIIDTKTEDIPYISFIHETFQEYLSARYIAENFLDGKEFPIDVTLPEWRETMKLVAEIVHYKSSGKKTISLIKEVQELFLDNSSYDSIDTHLSTFIEIFQSVAMLSDNVKRALDAYIGFNMNNYINLPAIERTSDLFGVLTDSMCLLDGNRVKYLIFGKYDWLHEWLYRNEKETPLEKESRSRKWLALAHSLIKADKKLPYFQLLSKLLDDNRFDGSVMSLVYAMEHFISPKVNPEEAKEIYLLTRELPILIQTHDPDFIEANIDNGNYNSLSQKWRLRIGRTMARSENKDILRILVEKYIPKTELFENIFEIISPRTIASIPDIQNWILDSKVWMQNAHVALGTLRCIPDEFWSNHHNDLVYKKIELLQDKKREFKMALKNICHSDNGTLLSLTGDDDMFSFLVSSAEFKEKFSDAVVGVYKLLRLKFAVREWYDAYDVTDNAFDGLPIIFKYEDENGMWLVLPKKFDNQFFRKNHLYKYGDKYLMIQSRQGKARLVIAPRNMQEDIEFETRFSKRFKNNQLSPDVIANEYGKYLSNRLFYNLMKGRIDDLSKNQLGHLHLFGMLPNRLLSHQNNHSYTIGLVLSVDNYVAKIITHKCTRILSRSAILYDILSSGDLVYKPTKEKTYLKIYTKERNVSTGFIYGKVTKIYEDCLIVRAIQDHETYVITGNSEEYCRGEKVMFFPTKITNVRLNMPNGYAIMRCQANDATIKEVR